MTHNLDIYYFINKFNISELKALDSNIKIIFRNYEEGNLEPVIRNLASFCKKNNRKLFISNNLRLALKYDLDGLYIPSFIKLINFKNLSLRKSFKLIGSAHNLNEIKIKEKQGCEEIFLSPIFYNPKNKYYLDIIKFNNLALNTNLKIIALGGINSFNFKKLLLHKPNFLAISGYIWNNKNLSPVEAIKKITYEN